MAVFYETYSEHIECGGTVKKGLFDILIFSVGKRTICLGLKISSLIYGYRTICMYAISRSRTKTPKTLPTQSTVRSKPPNFLINVNHRQYNGGTQNIQKKNASQTKDSDGAKEIFRHGTS
jgi:hypothetical protein